MTDMVYDIDAIARAMDEAMIAHWKTEHGWEDADFIRYGERPDGWAPDELHACEENDEHVRISAQAALDEIRRQLDTL